MKPAVAPTDNLLPTEDWEHEILLREDGTAALLMNGTVAVETVRFCNELRVAWRVHGPADRFYSMELMRGFLHLIPYLGDEAKAYARPPATLPHDEDEGEASSAPTKVRKWQRSKTTPRSKS